MKPASVNSDDLTAQILGFEDKLYRYALWLAHNQDDASDLVQETFLKAFTALADKKKKPAPGKLEAWLRRILHNRYIDLIRKKDPIKKPAGFIDTVGDQFGDAVLVDAFDLSQGIREEELLARVLERITDSDTLNIFRLRFIEELSIQEISEKIGFTPENVKIRLFRARKHLKEKWHVIDPELAGNDNVSPEIS